jgi:hypothetical protein
MPTDTRTIAVWQDQVRIRVLSKGRGPAVVNTVARLVRDFLEE